MRVLRLWGRKVFTKREPRKMTSAGMSAPWGETKRWGGGDNQSRGSHSALYRGTWRDGKVYLLRLAVAPQLSTVGTNKSYLP